MANRDAISSSSNVDTSPLLEGISREDEEEPITNRPSSPRRGRLSRLIRLMSGTGASARNTGRGIMREPSVLVRETAAEHLEERQSDWAYSKPIVILDLIWNLSFVIVAIVVLILSRIERPSNPLRLWIAVYAAQCCVHIACVCLEYRRRQQRSINTSTNSATATTTTTTTTPTTTATNTNGNASQRAQEQVGLSYVERPPRISESDDGDETFDEFRSTRIRLVFQFFFFSVNILDFSVFKNRKISYYIDLTQLNMSHSYIHMYICHMIRKYIYMYACVCIHIDMHVYVYVVLNKY